MKHFDLLQQPLSGRNLIEASAGTGKTYTLAALYLRLLLVKGLAVEEILVVTFTEAATEELRDRIRSRLRQAQRALETGPGEDSFLAALLQGIDDPALVRQRLADALACFDEAAVFTIHGFCQRTLQEHAFACGTFFDAELVTDQQALLLEIAEDFWRQRVFPASAGFVRHLQDRRLNPTSLVGLVGRHAQDTRLRVVPAGGAPSPEDAERRLAVSFVRLQQGWRQSGPEVLDLLASDPGLNRRRYSQGRIPRWGEALDRFVAGGEPERPCGDLERFTSTYLAECVKKGQRPPVHPFFDWADAFWREQQELQRLYEQSRLALIADFLAFARLQLPRRKTEQNIRFFDDLLLDVHRALTEAGGESLAGELRRRYPAALIDEFQDTDPVQYAIFHAIYPTADSPVFFIGDPKQAIYSFRGADIFAYLEAARQVDHRFTLDRNWRSTPQLVEAVNALFANRPAPFLFADIPFPQVTAACDPPGLRLPATFAPEPLQLWHLARPKEAKTTPAGTGTVAILEAVAGEVVRLLAAGRQGEAHIDGRPLEAGDIAILVRSNRQARLLQTLLTRLKVPSVLHAADSLFSSEEALQLLQVLAAVAEPRDEGRVRGALLSDLLGLSGSELAAMTGEETSWESWLETFREFHELWRQQGFIAMAHTFLARAGIRDRLLGLRDGERRLTNLLQAIEVLHQAILERHLGMEGALKWFSRQLHEVPENEEYQLRLETDDNAVKLVTIHKSKGLEYQVVFCPFCWEGTRRRQGETLRCHDPQDPQRLILDLGSSGEERETYRKQAEYEDLAENLRLLYVALTRAKLRCYLVWGALNGAESSAPAYLLHPAPAGVDPVAATAAHFTSLSDAAIKEDLRQLAARAPGAIGLAALPAKPAAPLPSPARSHPTLVCRSPRRGLFHDWRIASFSSLVAGGEAGEERGGWDEPRVFRGRDEEQAITPFRRGPFSFPRGTAAGSCLHGILEQADFADPAGAVNARLAAAQLARYGFADDWSEVALQMVAAALRVPLSGPGGDFTLTDVPAMQRVAEMEFFFPLERVTDKELGELFARHGGGEVPAGFAERLGHLEFTPVRGMLRGFIDLVFHHQGRYYLLDWKSNFLGTEPADYRQEALQAAMARDYYLLQYHLYAVALHKYLGARLPGYRYEEHFGGVFYLFLRGVDPAAPQYGVYQARPPLERLEALRGFLAGTAEGS